MLKITFLGTNGWYDTTTGNTVCTLVETDDEYIILDAGNGLHKVDEYIKIRKPIYLFLSHFHLDHIIGLHVLAKFNFPQGLSIFGQLGTKDILNKVINKPYTVPFSELPYQVDIKELPEGRHELLFSTECRYLHHSSPTLGFRFNLNNKVIAYCPDTGFCENAVKLADGADLLIAECALRTGEEIPGWPHLNPATAAHLAKDAGVKKLALIHFDADRYRKLTDREEAERVAQKIFPHTIATKDGIQVEI